MENSDRLLFKPRPATNLFNVGIGILSLFLTVFLFSLLIAVYMDNSVRILLFVLGGCSFLYGSYFLSFLWKQQLIVSERGILYQEPFVTLFSRWDNIKGVAFSQKFLVLFLDETKKTRSNLFLRWHLREEKIPIHYFVKDWQDRSSWQKNQLLYSISIYMPGLDKEVVKDG